MVQQGAWAVSGRSALAVTVAATVALASAPHRSALKDPAARLTAALLPFDPDLQSSAVDITAVALPDVTAAAALSISDGIIGGYLTIEQWVQYGVDLLSWALHWVPFGGLLASQLTMFYDLDESIVRSLVFNTAYLLDGTVGFVEASSNIGTATSTAFTTFVDDQIAWLHSLLPPPPPADALVPDPAPPLADPGAPADLVAELDGLLLGPVA